MPLDRMHRDTLIGYTRALIRPTLGEKPESDHLGVFRGITNAQYRYLHLFRSRNYIYLSTLPIHAGFVPFVFIMQYNVYTVSSSKTDADTLLLITKANQMQTNISHSVFQINLYNRNRMCGN